MQTKILIFTFALTCLTGFSQQDAQFTQYMYNTININPAYAGSRGVTSIFALHRTQWIGIDGAPVTNAFSINSPINDSNIGLGLSLISDNIGPTKNTAASGDFSYTIQTSETYKLSFGMKVSASIFDLDVSKLNPANQNDPTLQNFDNQVTLNFGAGIYFHSDKFYLGFSIPNIFRNTKYSDNNIAVYLERETFYLIGGYVFDLSQTIKFKPAFLTKLVAGAPIQVDATANFMFFDKFVLGGAYRWEAAFGALAGFQVTDGLFIGYTYDIETTALKNYNAGSHEVFLRYELFNKVRKLVSPRFF